MVAHLELRQTVVPGCTPDQSPFRAQNAPEKKPIYDGESILAHSTPFHGWWRAAGSWMSFLQHNLSDSHGSRQNPTFHLKNGSCSLSVENSSFLERSGFGLCLKEASFPSQASDLYRK